VSPTDGGKFLLREAAINDLDQLAAFIQQDSPTAAIRFLEAAEKTFCLLTRSPGLGEVFESRNPRLTGIRVWQVHNFRNILIFYRLVNRDVEVVRVLHGARDLAALFPEPEGEEPSGK
jgi:toxin ParE1/3/4